MKKAVMFLLFVVSLISLVGCGGMYYYSREEHWVSEGGTSYGYLIIECESDRRRTDYPRVIEEPPSYYRAHGEVNWDSRQAAQAPKKEAAAQESRPKKHKRSAITL